MLRNTLHGCLSTTSQIPKWNMKADYIESCKCDIDIHVILIAFQYMALQGLVLYHIQSENYRDIKLDNLDIIFA